MDNQKYEQMINSVYPGLTHFVRDADLNKELINKYKVNDIIYERAFVDSTYKIGGLTKSVRYSIFSNRAVDLNKISEVKNNWGLCVINKDSAFKVLDIYEYNDKTLITLLNIPLEYDDMFKNLSVNLDEKIIETSRKRFVECLNSNPVLELDDEWYKRLTFPLGMSDSGELFERPNEQ